MKKPSSSIRIEKPAGGKPAGPGALPGGIVFLAGLWAGVWQWLHSAGSLAPAVLPIAAAAAALCLGLLVRWEKPGQLAALAGEGGRVPADAVTLSVYPVEDSYLLQDALSRSGDDTPYRQGEAVYRQWVYDHYLTVPHTKTC